MHYTERTRNGWVESFPPLASQGVSNELLDPRISPLWKDPRKEELLDGLRTYLLSGCNVAKAAKRLYLHRNTLEYRIERIEGMTGTELKNLTQDEALRMIISCSIAMRPTRRFSRV